MRAGGGDGGEEEVVAFAKDGSLRRGGAGDENGVRRGGKCVGVWEESRG